MVTARAVVEKLAEDLATRRFGANAAQLRGDSKSCMRLLAECRKQLKAGRSTQELLDQMTAPVQRLWPVGGAEDAALLLRARLKEMPLMASAKTIMIMDELSSLPNLGFLKGLADVLATPLQDRLVSP